MRLSREAGAYKELHDNSLTDYPHLAPQYYGCWTTRLMSYSPEFEGRTRHVGLVLLELTQETSIQDLCHYDDDEVLIPPEGRICWDSDGPDLINFDEEKRKEFLALLLAGAVEQWLLREEQIKQELERRANLVPDGASNVLDHSRV
ncbi:hypothetical protein BDP55DRAFT_634708 [Colletotrichum godetiae]|uniref:Uncharacterized protein n=1 Tax=Colletotrichum godetiae TaxID=1209918 RepID=A0AAJ0AG84_9PEZI|nr:uncharacterized protein BDP55DRAFT_634708 [Colletotrichum godetiae]KAK1672695.1 hypothetical protein BDP55DRAFT_634708 [Colletotrichum godetiae]